MKKALLLICAVLSLSVANISQITYANPTANLGAIKGKRSQLTPIITPAPPALATKAHILIDANSGKILAEQNSSKRLPPASLTKLMTLYVISSALKSGQIKLSDKVRISTKAWKTGGSRMFVKQGQQVNVESLLKGIIVDSGNDACVAMAEYLAGSEKDFAKLMNTQAKALGMNDSHFTDSTGLPNKNHYSTAKDLAILSQALVNDFPQYYSWYKQKWFTFNGIKQPNRNRLLWRDSAVDGLKTGHTNEAGYCLVASAKKNGMRLLSVVLGSKNESSRADSSQRLLNYGFRFFETHRLYSANDKIAQLRVYKGELSNVAIGVKHPLYVTIPKGQYQNLKIETQSDAKLIAPIDENVKVGELVVKLNDSIIQSQPLYTLNKVVEGSFVSRTKDAINLKFSSWFGKG